MGAWHRARPVAKRQDVPVARHQALRLATRAGLGSKLCVAPPNGTAFERYTPLLEDIDSIFLLSDLKPLAKSIWNVQGVLVLLLVLQVFVRTRLGVSSLYSLLFL